jgi:anaerobic selenocysteine-containing dehydrogenase
MAEGEGAARTGDRRTVHRSCSLCEASCGLVIDVVGNEVVSIRGDVDDPFSRGYLCPKGVALQDLVTDPDRLRTPVRRREDGSWEPMGWDDALDLVADRLTEIRDRDGGDAIALYLGNPITHGWAPVTFIPMLIDALGTRGRYSAASVDQQPQHLLAYLLFGSPLLFPVPDIDRTDLLLVIGGNPVVSNGSIMTAPDMRRRIGDLRRRGGRLVVLDPRRTETADLADEHVAVRPGTDVWLLAAMVQVITSEGLARPGRAAQFVDGLEQVPELVREVTPERAAAVTGVPADTIRRLARELASARRAAVYGRLGVTQSVYGTAAYWLIHCLNILTGRLDEIGGVMFATPAFDLPAIGAATTDLIGYDRWRSRVRGIPEFAAEFPLATLADEILTPGEGQVRALVLYAGNPVLSAPDGRRMEEALADLEFCVAVDHYVTESTRHADVILPPTTSLERDEFDVVFPAVSVRNWVRWNPAAVRPGPGERSDAEILVALLGRVWRRTPRFRRTAAAREAGLRRLFPGAFVDAALRAGPYGLRARGPVRGLSLRRVRRAVHGLDLGPLVRQLPGRLMTDGSRIDLAHPVVVADWPRVLDGLAEAERLAPDTEFDLLLIGRRHLRTNNSWMHNSERLTKGRSRFTVQINPEDAAERGLVDGAPAVLTSQIGSIEVPVEVTDRLMRGVVSVPHGFGHDRAGSPTSWRRAASLGGASVNDVTDSARIDPVSGNAAVQGVPVRVEPGRS